MTCAYKLPPLPGEKKEANTTQIDLRLIMLLMPFRMQNFAGEQMKNSIQRCKKTLSFGRARRMLRTSNTSAHAITYTLSAPGCLHNKSTRTAPVTGSHHSHTLFRQH